MRGEGRPKTLKKCMKVIWNFQRVDEGFLRKKIRSRGMDIFGTKCMHYISA